MVEGLWFMVYGSGLGFRVSGGLRVQGAEFIVQVLVFRV